MPANQNLAAQAVQAAVQRIKSLSANMATQINQPIDGEAPSRAEQARLWNLQNPAADPQQVQALVNAGLHSQAVDLMYPWRSKLIGSGDPQTKVDRAEAFSKMASNAEPAPAPTEAPNANP